MKELKPLFPFGFGLSYTTFEYSNMRVSKTEIKDTETVDVFVTVKNTGAVEGKEAVQLYVGDDQSTLIRPVKELKDFAKVSLKPGESKEVKFTLGFRAFAYWNHRIHDWHVETGTFTLYACASSADVRQKVQITVNSTRQIIKKVTRDTPAFVFYQIPAAQKYVKALQDCLPTNPPPEVGADAVGMFKEIARTSPIRGAVVYSRGKLTFEQLDEMIADVNAQLGY